MQSHDGQRSPTRLAISEIDLIQAWIAPKIIQELVRHSTITLTIDRYSHTDDKRRRKGLWTRNPVTMRTDDLASAHCLQSSRHPMPFSAILCAIQADTAERWKTLRKTAVTRESTRPRIPWS